MKQIELNLRKEVKELINQHKDIVKLISLDKRCVCIEQIEQQDFILSKILLCKLKLIEML